MTDISTANGRVANFLRRQTFHLQVETLDQSAFFSPFFDRNSSNASIADLPSTILNNRSRPTGPGLLTELERAFFDYNGDVWMSNEGLADFSAALFELFRYISPPELTVQKGKKSSFPPLGLDFEPIEIDVPAVVVNRKGESLLLALNCSGKNPSRGPEYEPYIAAASMAVHRQNSIIRAQHGHGTAGRREMYCIAMIGSAPVFYRTTMESSLVDHLERPGQSLILKKFVPSVPDQGRYVVDGMVPLENRKIVFQCLELFRKLLQQPLY